MVEKLEPRPYSLSFIIFTRILEDWTTMPYLWAPILFSIMCPYYLKTNKKNTETSKYSKRKKRGGFSTPTLYHREHVFIFLKNS